MTATRAISQCRGHIYRNLSINTNLLHSLHGALHRKVANKNRGCCGILGIDQCLFYMMAYYLDRVAGTDFVRDAACLAFVCNEALSIVENFGLMGVPIPDAITNAIDVLKGKKDTK